MFEVKWLNVCVIISIAAVWNLYAVGFTALADEFIIPWTHDICMDKLFSLVGNRNLKKEKVRKSRAVRKKSRRSWSRRRKNAEVAINFNILQAHSDAWVIWLKNHNRACKVFSSHICNIRVVFISKCLTTTTSCTVALDPGAATALLVACTHKKRNVRTIWVHFWSANKALWNKTF